jgi:hypothetical protein
VTLYQAGVWTDSKPKLKISRSPVRVTSVGTGHGSDAGLFGARGAPVRRQAGGAGSGEAKTQRQRSGR